eukprot:ANDGO_00687.mRNA.1 hypothetical protein
MDQQQMLRLVAADNERRGFTSSRPIAIHTPPPPPPPLPPPPPSCPPGLSGLGSCSATTTGCARNASNTGNGTAPTCPSSSGWASSGSFGVTPLLPLSPAVSRPFPFAASFSQILVPGLSTSGSTSSSSDLSVVGPLCAWKIRGKVPATFRTVEAAFRNVKSSHDPYEHGQIHELYKTWKYNIQLSMKMATSETASFRSWISLHECLPDGSLGMRKEGAFILERNAADSSITEVEFSGARVGSQSPPDGLKSVTATACGLCFSFISERTGSNVTDRKRYAFVIRTAPDPAGPYETFELVSPSFVIFGRARQHCYKTERAQKEGKIIQSRRPLLNGFSNPNSVGSDSGDGEEEDGASANLPADLSQPLDGEEESVLRLLQEACAAEIRSRIRDPARRRLLTLKLASSLKRQSVQDTSSLATPTSSAFVAHTHPLDVASTASSLCANGGRPVTPSSTGNAGFGIADYVLGHRQSDTANGLIPGFSNFTSTTSLLSRSFSSFDPAFTFVRSMSDVSSGRLIHEIAADEPPAKSSRHC